MDAIAPLRSAHWRILTPQTRHWVSVLPLIRDGKENRTTQAEELLRIRFENINDAHPLLCALGQHGFRGYILFGFPERGIVLLEGLQLNHTHVIKSNWSEICGEGLLSLLSKPCLKISHFGDWRHQLFQALDHTY
jgi:hypothetical protein